MASKDWKSQPILVKQYFDTLAKLSLQRHKETYPGYIYRPRQNKRKKFREVTKDKFIERTTNENNGNKKKQVGRKVVNNAAGDNERLQTLVEDESALLNNAICFINVSYENVPSGELIGYNAQDPSTECYGLVPYVDERQHSLDEISGM
ncbi:7654_t:CDS:1 [Paraglomus occultum]|uniref:7654_t:CDS:1 n=1 Tax=Paraglomus occultum TaxID=144539 RepID=A0A9N8VRN9_9GLOM|nr:7654_t:CDS:1 [Paraglomus occultum]